MCPSEVSDVEHSLWQAYKDDGVVVWGVAAAREPLDDVVTFAEQYGLTFPILHDETGKIGEQYAQELAFPTAAFPQDWVIGVDGTVVYANNGFELDAMVTAIEGELD